jgi:hypothetical protein
LLATRHEFVFERLLSLHPHNYTHHPKRRQGENTPAPPGPSRPRPKGRGLPRYGSMAPQHVLWIIDNLRFGYSEHEIHQVDLLAKSAAVSSHPIGSGDCPQWISGLGIRVGQPTRTVRRTSLHYVYTCDLTSIVVRPRCN